MELSRLRAENKRYQDDANDAEHVAELRHTAELWSEFGRVENYSASPLPGRDDVVQVSVNSARHDAPEVQAARQRHAQISREVELWLWVEKCFSSGQWAPGFAHDEAFGRAAELSAAQAAGELQSLMPDGGYTDGAIAVPPRPSSVIPTSRRTHNGRRR
ncbi:protein of unknown function (plasmid) [Cupriavidus taiwanensis]|nr:protein of unknown function [Cupriavidus taiwanensis]